MLKTVAVAYVFLGGFALMVLEIVGARYLARHFGGSHNVWISQIGVILIALALGYAVGGTLADRWRRAGALALPLLLVGGLTALIPHFTPALLTALMGRHPPDREIPVLWQRLDPAMGSALIFFLPCFVLATLCPYMIRLTAQRLEHVGTVSGLVYAASTVGGIAGVFISGYALMDYFAVSTIFRATGGLLCLMAGLSWAMDRWLVRRVEANPAAFLNSSETS